MSGTKSSSDDETHQRNNDPDDNQTQRIWEVNKIGNFDEDTWIEVFRLLSIRELAVVATVCRKFQTLAHHVFEIRNRDAREVFCDIDKAGWRPAACRFRNLMPRMYFSGTKKCSNSKKGVLRFIDEFLNESLTNLRLGIDPTEFRKFTFRKKFVNLEKLTLINVDSAGVLAKLNKWCPNLKSLVVTNSRIDGPDFYFQALPFLECLKFDNVILNTTIGYINDFFSTNNQLKEVAIEGVEAWESDLSWFKVINDNLPELETMTWATETLDNLPELRNNFAELKSLSFLMAVRDGGSGTCSGTCKNQLLRIVKHLPKIEILRVINCRQNFMTNEDLVELIVESSSTLQQLIITSSESARALTFGYDLHRQIYGTTNRSKLSICFDFGDAFLNFRNIFAGKEGVLKKIKITSDGIWENDNLIVLASKNG